MYEVYIFTHILWMRFCDAIFKEIRFETGRAKGQTTTNKKTELEIIIKRTTWLLINKKTGDMSLPGNDFDGFILTNYPWKNMSLSNFFRGNNKYVLLPRGGGIELLLFVIVYYFC